MSYTVTIEDEDSAVSDYGVAPSVETVDVCETWTGYDYQTQLTVQTSNSPEFDQPDAARIVTYAGGQVEGYHADQSYQIGAGVGSSAFEMVEATSAEIQASYDEPYYGVYGGGGGGGGGGDPCIEPPCDEFLRTGDADAGKNRPGQPGLRHNLRRRGVRYLMNGYDEVAAQQPGRRRFQKRDGDLTVTVELDKNTELLVAEDRVSPREVVHTKHFWKRAPDGGFVRERTTIDAEDKLSDGRTATQRITITISNLKRRPQ